MDYLQQAKNMLDHAKREAVASNKMQHVEAAIRMLELAIKEIEKKNSN